MAVMRSFGDILPIIALLIIQPFGENIKNHWNDQQDSDQRCNSLPSCKHIFISLKIILIKTTRLIVPQV